MTELQELFDTIRVSSWRWERQPYYAVDLPEVERWRRGEPSDPNRKEPWLDFIRDLTGGGVPFERVRMLQEPPTEYQRWIIQQTAPNIAAGEDIRWISASDVPEGAPDYDFYLIDDERVGIMRFDTDMLLIGVDVVDDPAIVSEHRRWRDTVWPHATRHADFLTRSP